MVACGLAMGVFVGLVVVRGTGEAEGAVTATVNPAPPPKREEEAVQPAAETPPPDPEPAAEPPAPDPATALLTFNVTPKDAVVTVDGSTADGGKAEVKLVDGKSRVRLVAKADGYKTYEKSHLVTDDEAISIDLVKKSRRSSGGSKGPSGPGGLIDLR